MPMDYQLVRKQSSRVRRFIGRLKFCNHDHLLMLNEFLVDKHGGFPDHLHLRFETASCMVKGLLQREASAGHRGMIGLKVCNRWLRGRGVVHSEMPVKCQTRAHKR